MIVCMVVQADDTERVSIRRVSIFATQISFKRLMVHAISTVNPQRPHELCFLSDPLPFRLPNEREEPGPSAVGVEPPLPAGMAPDGSARLKKKSVTLPLSMSAYLD